MLFIRIANWKSTIESPLMLTEYSSISKIYPLVTSLLNDFYGRKDIVWTRANLKQPIRPGSHVPWGSLRCSNTFWVCVHLLEVAILRGNCWDFWITIGLVSPALACHLGHIDSTSFHILQKFAYRRSRTGGRYFSLPIYFSALFT